MDQLSRLREMTHKVRRGTSIALWVCLTVTVVLFGASFVVPPTGVIDPSVLKAIAWMFAFATLFVAREAIMEGLGVKVTHGSTTIEVKDQDGKGDPKEEEPQPINQEDDAED